MAEQWDQKSWSCIDSQEAESEWEVGLNYTSSRPAPSDHFRQQASYLKGSTRTSQPAPGHQVFRYMSLWGVFHKGVVKSNGLSVLLQFILQLGNPGIGYILLICLFFNYSIYSWRTYKGCFFFLRSLFYTKFNFPLMLEMSRTIIINVKHT